MDVEDQIEYILEGLSDDYKQVADQIQSREVPPSLTEIHEKLLNHEVKLQSVVANSSPLPVSANVASYRPSGNNNNRNNNNGNRGHNRYNNRNSQTWQQQQQFQPRQDQGSRGYQGKCQICGVFGHSARRCSLFKGQVPPPAVPLRSTHHRKSRGNLVPIWQPCLTIQTIGYSTVEQPIT